MPGEGNFRFALKRLRGFPRSKIQNYLSCRRHLRDALNAASQSLRPSHRPCGTSPGRPGVEFDTVQRPFNNLLKIRDDHHLMPERCVP